MTKVASPQLSVLLSDLMSEDAAATQSDRSARGEGEGFAPLPQGTTDDLPEIHLLTLFPEELASSFQTSILGRALKAGHFRLYFHNPRDFGLGRYHKVDDTLAGGGRGLLLRCEPLAACMEALFERFPDLRKEARRYYFSPKGPRLNQARVQELSQASKLIFLCGHYEGVDERFLQAYAFQPLSIGDFVLTGGEWAALVTIDAVARLYKGVLPASEAFEQESHYAGLLEEPQYTKPASWQGRAIPPVLLSGHHEQMQNWKRLASWEETLKYRPDLLDQQLAKASTEEIEDFVCYLQQNLGERKK